MAAWGTFAAAALEDGRSRCVTPECRRRLHRNDGKRRLPRVHPFTPLISEGRLLAFIGIHTVKYHNLRREGSRMLAVVEAAKDQHDQQNEMAFEFTIEFAQWAIWRGLGTPDIRRGAKAWRAP